MTCKDLHIDCSGKPFSKMPKMGKVIDFEGVVRCVDFKHKTGTDRCIENHLQRIYTNCTKFKMVEWDKNLCVSTKNNLCVYVRVLQEQQTIKIAEAQILSSLSNYKNELLLKYIPDRCGITKGLLDSIKEFGDDANSLLEYLMSDSIDSFVKDIIKKESLIKLVDPTTTSCGKPVNTFILRETKYLTYIKGE